MSSERLENLEDELKALLDQVQNSVTYQLPTKVGGEHEFLNIIVLVPLCEWNFNYYYHYSSIVQCSNKLYGLVCTSFR